MASTFITVNYHIPSGISQLNSHFFCKSEHKTCLTNYHTGLKRKSKIQGSLVQGSEEKAEQFLQQKFKELPHFVGITSCLCALSGIHPNGRNPMSAIPSSGKIFNSGNRYQSYLNILVLCPKRKMPVGWLRMLGVILDIGFCTGRVKFSLLSLCLTLKL